MTNQTTPNFRALYAELVDELNYHADEHSVDKLIARAGAALATPPPEPTDGEVAELVARLKAIRNDYGVQHSADCQRAAELLERTAAPPPEPPTDEELLDLFQWHGALSFARAVLERWRK